MLNPQLKDVNLQMDCKTTYECCKKRQHNFQYILSCSKKRVTWVQKSQDCLVLLSRERMNVPVNRCGLKSVLWNLIYSPNNTRLQTQLKVILLRMELMNAYQDHDNYNFRRYLTGFYYIIILLSCEHFILHDCMG